MIVTTASIVMVMKEAISILTTAVATVEIVEEEK
jgi:hypothetical protein